jgi:hypothetical protein
MSLFVRAFFFFHLALFIERCCATFVGLNSKCSGYLGVVLGCSMVSFFVVLQRGFVLFSMKFLSVLGENVKFFCKPLRFVGFLKINSTGWIKENAVYLGKNLLSHPN